jgi:hypothetical protein
MARRERVRGSLRSEMERKEGGGGREDRCIIFSQFLLVFLSILLHMHAQQADEDENS